MGMEKLGIELDAAQRRKLERLWMYFGNNGPKHTHGNHYFIQGILEKAKWDTEWNKVSGECQLKVIDVLGFDPEKENDSRKSQDQKE